MNKPHDNPEGAPLTVKIGWGALLLIVGGAIVWWLGVSHLDEILGVDIQCDDTRYYGRGAELAEIVRCGMAAGVGGWVYLVWMAAFPLVTFLWMERQLRRITLARRNMKKRG